MSALGKVQHPAYVPSKNSFIKLGRFGHSMVTSTKDVLGTEALNLVIDHTTQLMLDDDTHAVATANTLVEVLDVLCQRRTEEGYMADVGPSENDDLLLDAVATEWCSYRVL
jgi:predicted ArsR family transcriptional regulator